MRGKHYISFVLLMIFIAAVGCQTATSFMCSCHEDHHQVEHVCCHCPKHISTCANHDEVLRPACCGFHHTVDNTSLFISSHESRDFKLHLPLQLDLVRFMCKLVELDDVDVDYLFDDSRCLLHLSRWSMASYSLTSPPALV